MAHPEHLAKLKEGAKAWKEWRGEFHTTTPNFGGAPLSCAKLGGFDLSDADLSGANLTQAQARGAILVGANLGDAKLYAADFSGADLAYASVRNARVDSANLFQANLVGTIFSGADLENANLQHANLRGADLQGASFEGTLVGFTIFGDIDLSATKGLEAVQHNYPSTVGIDTIYRSKGNVPEKFLRGCGVPEDFITYAKSLAAHPIEFYSCFISYAFKDQDFADRLYADLQNKGVRCWFAPHDVQGGRKLHEQIDEAIRLHDKLLLILSPHSMESEWVKTEIAKARKREVRDPEGVLKRRVLFPIRLAPFETLRDWECFDADTGKDSAREIREYFIPDFSNWKDHDSYQEAFKRLISDLKASDARPPATQPTHPK
jgi:hypothetical protein